ncbi:hypothetical protein [Paracoccus sp. Ld10]|uniref:hypothetical protein n=1 Tax=Paracoccus sp. Ld10 TaxID=649158 RepID=UPI003863D535
MPDYIAPLNHKSSEIDVMAENKRGRPSVDTSAINVRLPNDIILLIDDRRRDEPDLPTRPEMIRRALVQWLEMTKAGK